MDFFERLLVESGPDLADVHQSAVFITAENERAEVIAVAVREAADNEVPGRDHFDLEPVAGSPAFVFAIAALADDAFQSMSASRFEHGVAISDKGIGKTDSVGWGHDFSEQLPPSFERHSTEIVAIEVQQIE